jgi:hypothetical protein
MINLYSLWHLCAACFLLFVFWIPCWWIATSPNDLMMNTTSNVWTKIKEDLNYSSFSLHRMSKRKNPSRIISCMPETFANVSWNRNPVSVSTIDSQVLLQSCLYEFICYDIFHRIFVLFPSVHHYRVLVRLHSSIFLSSLPKPVILSTISNDDFINNKSVAGIKPIYRKFRSKDNHFIIYEDYYDRDKDESIWIPIQLSKSSKSILWDVYFPIFSLLELFDLTSKKFHILLIPSDGNDIDITLERERINQFSDSMKLPRLKILSLSFTTEIRDQRNLIDHLCFPPGCNGNRRTGLLQSQSLEIFSKECNIK